MNKILKLTLLLSMIGLFFSCHCDDLLCKQLDSQSLEWSRFNVGDTIKYINSAGSEINFITNSKILTPNSVECRQNGYGGCGCSGGCGSPFIETKAKTKDSSRNGINIQGKRYYADELQMKIDKIFPDSNIVALNYSIFYHQNRIYIGPSLSLDNTNDSILTTFNIGTTTYNNVIVHEADTTADYIFVWKSYYTKVFGIIAFFDRKTQTMFYRRP